MKAEIEIKNGICKSLKINNSDFLKNRIRNFKFEMEAGEIPVLTMSMYPEEVIIKTDDVKIRKRKIKM